MARDPVCGMTVDEENARFETDWKGKSYYFCSPGCLASFKAHPEKFARA